MLRLTRISQRYAADRLCHRTVRVARSRVWVRAGVARKEVTLAKPANAESPRFHRPMGFVHPGGSQLVVQAVERASLPSRERSSTFGSPELPQNQTAPRRDDGDGGRTRRWVPARGRHQVADIPRAVERLLALLPPGPVGAAGAAGNRRGGGALAGLAAILASRVSPAGVSPVHGSAQAAPRQVRGLRGIRRYQRRGRHRQPGPGVGQDGGGTDRVDAGGARRVPQVHRVSHPGGRLRGERR